MALDTQGPKTLASATRTAGRRKRLIVRGESAKPGTSSHSNQHPNASSRTLRLRVGHNGSVDATELRNDLVDAPRTQWVRLVAQWIEWATVDRTLDPDSEPDLTDDPARDALVAAAMAYVSQQRDIPVPSWTSKPARRLDRFWHPGPTALLPNALVHAPEAFFARGVLIERDSLVSV